MILKHCYLTTSFGDFEDYDLICAQKAGKDISDYLYTNEDELINKNILYNEHPPKGSDVYVFPDCKYSKDDVKRNYNVRSINKCSYAIVPRFSWLHQVKRFTYSCIAVCKSKKIAAAGNYSLRMLSRDQIKKNLIDVLQQVDKGIQAKDVEFDMSWTRHLYKVGKWSDYSYVMYNRGVKCIIEKNIDMSTGNELNTDLLQIVYKLGGAAPTGDSIKNLKLQLNIINGHDWRKHIPTVGVIMHSVRLRYGTTGHKLFNNEEYKKALTKPEKELLSLDWYAIRECKDDDELAFCFETLMKCLNMSGTTFSSYKDFLINTSRFPSDVIRKFFDVDVRIKPKTIDRIKNEE